MPREAPVTSAVLPSRFITPWYLVFISFLVCLAARAIRDVKALGGRADKAGRRLFRFRSFRYRDISGLIAQLLLERRSSARLPRGRRSTRHLRRFCSICTTVRRKTNVLIVKRKRP